MGFCMNCRFMEDIYNIYVCSLCKKDYKFIKYV